MAGDFFMICHPHLHHIGASQSAQVAEEEEDEDDDAVQRDIPDSAGDHSVVKKILEQEPEMLQCHASASPLSPQLSAYGTPRTGPSIKVWDPYNVLAPPPTLPPLPAHFHRTFSAAAADDDRAVTEVYLISHGECHMNLRPDLVAGCCPDASLTSAYSPPSAQPVRVRLQPFQACRHQLDFLLLISLDRGPR